MKTALFTFTYLHGMDGQVSRLERAKKFLKYYTPLANRLGFDDIIISDNGGSQEQLHEVIALSPTIRFICNPLMFRGEHWDYLPCWRQQYDVQCAIDLGYDKIIILDDDAYLLSDRVLTYVKQLKTGWTSFYCPKHNFPEAAISVLCRDAFSRFEAFTSIPYTHWNGKAPMELLMPYTHVEKDFNIDRFGEDNLPQMPDMDGYCQCPGGLILKVEGNEPV